MQAVISPDYFHLAVDYEDIDGGGGEIRTHGRGLPYNDFQDRRLQPLGHPSARRIKYYIRRKIILKRSSICYNTDVEILIQRQLALSLNE